MLAVGDEAFQRKCMERIYGFRRAGKTIIFVSHALETVRALCDVGVWLDHGVARAEGPAGQVIDAYLGVGLTPAQLAGLTLTPPADFAGTINLTASVTATDGTDTETTTTPRAALPPTMALFG